MTRTPPVDRSFRRHRRRSRPARPAWRWRRPSSRSPRSTPCPSSSSGSSRIHKALKAAEARGEIEYKATENVANADYERVMREYATGGNQLIVGEAFAVEAAARKVAKDFPKVSFLMGSSGKPQAPNFSVFDNYIQEPAYLTGHGRRRHDQDATRSAWSAASRSPR